MSLVADGKILLNLLRGMPKEGEAASKLERFYAGQADAYDSFRERLLHGRAELIEALELPDQAHVVELGGGTGRNIDFFGTKLNQIKQYEVVDLCASLLAVARKRASQSNNIQVVEANACHYQPSAPVDLVIFSYSLTMIPDWELALDNAKKMLKPNGKIVVVDFTLSDQQSRWISLFWQKWFGHDGVYLNPAQANRLKKLFPNGQYTEAFAKVPYLPFIRVPYYRFIG